jgi:hypothetical protein
VARNLHTQSDELRLRHRRCLRRLLHLFIAIIFVVLIVVPISIVCHARLLLRRKK